MAAFIQHRVLPLQFRPHLICDMGGRRDPNQTSTKEMSAYEVAYRVKSISGSQFKVGSWTFSMEPYSRANPRLMVRVRFDCSILCILILLT